MPIQEIPIHLKDFIGGLNKVNPKNQSDLRGATDINGIIFPQKGVLSNFPGVEEALPASQVSGLPLFVFEYYNAAGTLIPILYSEIDSDISSPSTNTGQIYTIDLQNKTATPIGTVAGGSIVDAFQSKAAAYDEPILIFTGDNFTTKQWKYGDASITNLAGWLPTYADAAATPYSGTYTAATPEFTFSAECRGGASFANRGWLIPVSPEDKVAYSALLDVNDWDNDQGDVNHGGHLDIKPGDGNGRLLKLIPEKATQDHVERLLCCKERAIYAIVGDTPYDIYLETGKGRPFEVITLISGSGLGAQHSVIVQSNDTFYLNQNRQAKTVQLSIKNAEAEELTVSAPIAPIFNKIPKKALRYVFTEDYIRRNQIWITHYKGFAEHDEDVVASTTRALFHFDTLRDASSNQYLFTQGGAGAISYFRGFNGYGEDCIGVGPSGAARFLAITSGIGSAFTAFTFSLWFKPKALPTSGNKQYILNLDHSAGKLAIYLYNDSGTQKIVGSMWNGSNVEQSISHTETLEIDDSAIWHNAVITWSGTSFKFYFNGVIVGTLAVPSMYASGTNGLAIGSSSATSEANAAHAFIDELFITNEARTATQISDFFNDVSRGNNMLSMYDYKNNNWSVYDGVNASCLYYDGKYIYSTAAA